MDKATLISSLKNIVSPYAMNKEALENITESTDLVRDLKVNSANLVDVVLDVEEKFNIVIDNESMERMINVGAILEVIEGKLAM
jgi:acyl carrier protein